MTKLIAVLNVVAWSGFWAFGYLALAAGDGGGSVVVASLLAFAGAAVGIFAFLWLVRHSEETGYAQKPGRKRPTGAGPVNAETPE